MSRADTDKTFLGRGWSFPPEFQRLSKETKVVSGEEDILQSLLILLSTRPGERLMHPTFGCGIHEMVFESINESTITEIRDRIGRAILFFEPRITLDRIDVASEDVLDGFLRIQIAFTVRATNSRSNLVYPFYFREGTHLARPETQDDSA